MVVQQLRICLPASLRRAVRSYSSYLPPLNFITLHYTYFIAVCMISSVIFWGSSTPPRSVTYTDSLFLAVSAMSGAGLNTINLSTLNTFQQFILFLLIMLGSAVLVSSAVVHVRKKAFERKFNHIIKQERERRRAEKERDGGQTGRFSRTFSRGISRPYNEPDVDLAAAKGSTVHATNPEDESAIELDEDHPHTELEVTRSIDQSRGRVNGNIGSEGNNVSPSETNKDLDGSPELISSRIRFASPSSPFSPRARTRVFSMAGVGARPDILNHPKQVAPAYEIPLAALDSEPGDTSRGTLKYFKSGGFVGRNSQFHSLTLTERERLGGVEYRAITLLELIVPLYFFLWQLLGSLGIGAWIAYNAPDVTLSNGLNPWWTGAFNAVSAFCNSGMSLLDANMVAFQTSTYMLITMSLLILAGNTCYPVFLRFIIWTMSQILPDKPAFHEYKVTLRFLLDHPRRCYTTLFPSSHTWWLLLTLIILNGTDWAAFEILNIGNPIITTLPPGARVLDGLFQAFAVRSGGFYVVPIASLRIGLLVLYVLMMYISVYPVVITMRNSNVYEERSLGIYADSPAPALPQSPLLHTLRRRLTTTLSTRASSPIPVRASETSPSRPPRAPRGYFVRQQLRGQLAHDLWWIVLAILLITITETSQFEADPVDYSVFNIVFEVISAYGCVGISVGLPNVAYSFCGGWHVVSKLILCAVMLRGRHRGLPVAIDRAVLLPGEGLGWAEEEDAQIRMSRAVTRERAEV